MKACVFTLGCKMNEVESASLMRGLEARGYEVTDELCAADLYLINTCAVTAEAEKKSRQAVARVRRYNPEAAVVVCGCASQHAPQAFMQKEGVVLVTGAQRKGELLDLLGQTGVFLGEEERAFCEMPPPKRTKTRAFLRVQDGCNRFCSYCLIPYLRGRTRSREISLIREEASRLQAKEIVLTGIDVSSYRDGTHDLGDLLLALREVPSRIRLGSLEAGVVSEEFLQKMKEAGNVVPHFHLSLQSGSTAVLRSMNRHYTREEFLQTCARVYRYFPDAAITTDLIVGFPTEREEDFEESLSIVREAGFAQVHAFPYSRREGTAAAKLPDLAPSVKRERMARMLAAVKEQEERYLLRFVGKTVTVLFEEEGGYSEQYLRVYAEGAREGALCRVRPVGREKDGLSAEILEEV